jgi:hypothetical protein
MTTRQKAKAFGAFVAGVLATCVPTSAQSVKVPMDPGVRGGAAGAGSPLPGLTADESAFFRDGLARFADIEVVTGGNNNGLGPRFNSNQCLSCHSQPVGGGSSPPRNPLIGIASLNGAKNVVPWFITENGPIREARFKRNPNGTNDGGVHNLFVIAGRSDAAGCNIAQPNFLPAGSPLPGQGGNPNIIFRIPTPVFGAGLIEAISDSAILANMKADASLKAELGISGHPNAHLSGNANRSANDGTITRFGWKAQNKSLLMFAGEAYNVEMGITNQLFPQERDENSWLSLQRHARRHGQLHAYLHAPFQHSRPLRHRGVCQLHEDAGPAHSDARHAVDREWTGYFHQDRLCPLPHAFAHDRQDDCQRLLDDPECRAFQPDCESLLRRPGSPHGQRSCRRRHARWRRPR